MMTTPSGYVIHDGWHYLQHVPRDGSFVFRTPSLQDATVFSAEDSARLAADYPGEIHPDPLQRPPDIWRER